VAKKNIKILGSGPTGALLALNLASKECNITLIEPLEEKDLLSKDKGYAITQSSRRIFEKFGLWQSIENSAFGFTTLSIIDQEISNSVIVRADDLKELNYNQTNLGWVIDHRDLMTILINSTNSNRYINKFRVDTTDDKTFDFVLAADGRDSLSRKKWNIRYLKRFYSQRCISFKAILKGAPAKRAYEIFRHEGPLALLPLKDNTYQIIWFSSIADTQKKLKLTNYELLESLTKILPDKIIAVKVVSEISNYSVAKAFALPKISNYKKIIVGDSAHSFHPVGGQGLNSCIRDVYELIKILNNIDNKPKLYCKFTHLNYYLKRTIDIVSLILFTDLLIKLFSNKIKFIYPLRNLIFYLLRKIKFIRSNVFSLMTDSIKRYR